MSSCSFKKNFDEEYNSPTPVKYYKSILKEMNQLEHLEIESKYFDKHLLNQVASWINERKTLLVLDFLSSYGSSTLGIVHGYSAEDFHQNWNHEDDCGVLLKKRKFACKTVGIDMSAEALNFGRKVGIFDETLEMDLNIPSSDQESMLRNLCRNSNIFHINSMSYVKEATFNRLLDWFCEGTNPGLLVAHFSIFQAPDVIRREKYKILKQLDFFNSVPCQGRKLSPEESAKFGPITGHFAFSYNEMWFAFRN